MNIPLRLRLAIAYCTTFLVVIAILEAGTYFAARAAVDSIVDHELQTRLAGIDDHLTRHIGKYPWPKLAASFAEHPAFQPAYFSLQSAEGESLIEGSLLRAVKMAPFPTQPFIRTVESGSDVVRILQVRRTLQGRQYDLALATDLRIPAGILGRLWLIMVLTAPLILLAASAIGYWLAGKALSPVAGMIAAAQAIDTNKLNQRLEVPTTGDEIRLLAETINRMLARIEDGVRNIREFTANASHELRTPIAIIRAASEIALTQPGQDEIRYREALQRILRESERNSVMLNGMLEMARLDAGVDRAKRSRVSLVDSVASACKQVLPLAEANQLVLKWNAPESSPHVFASEEHLRRLWVALLENAIRYTPPGASITVAVEYGQKGDACCVFRDAGIGIASEHLPRLFERFYRVDKARSRDKGGCGLGLSIAAELASMHGASISVTSQVGVGSEFRVRFPAGVMLVREAEPETLLGC